MRYLPIALFCLLLAACGSANESNTPTGGNACGPAGNSAEPAVKGDAGAAVAVEEFLKASLDGDRDKALSFISKEERESEGKGGGSIGLNAEGTMKGYTVGEAFVEEGTTMVPVHITYNNGDPASDMDVVMVDEDGEWRVQFMATIFRELKKKKDE